jgi:hypothetical protein
MVNLSSRAGSPPAQGGGLSIIDHVGQFAAGNARQAIDETHDDLPHDKNDGRGSADLEPSFVVFSDDHKGACAPSIFLPISNETAC